MPNWPKCSPPNKGGGGDLLQPPYVLRTMASLKMATELLIQGAETAETRPVSSINISSDVKI
jgi:hypothetical protein